MRETEKLLVLALTLIALASGYLLIPPEITVQHRQLYPLPVLERTELKRPVIDGTSLTTRNLFQAPVAKAPLKPPGTVEVKMIKPVQKLVPAPSLPTRHSRLELLGWQVDLAAGNEQAFLWDGEQIHIVRRGENFLADRYRLEALRTGGVLLYDNLRHRMEEVTHHR